LNALKKNDFHDAPLYEKVPCYFRTFVCVILLDNFAGRKVEILCYTTLMHASSATPLPLFRIFKTWWPLAASWLLMGIEGPAMSAVIARLANPEIHLAAYGGVVFPLSLIVESPIIMLLAASTALSKDWASYARLRRYMMAAGATLTGLHFLVAYTPLYYLVVEKVIGVPPEIVQPARLGLMIMLPWTWSIAYRRFHQGVLIRFGRSQTVGIGTVVRLSADGLVLMLGYLVKTVPGVVVGTTAVAVGVMSEAAYVGLVVRPVLRGPLRLAPPVAQPVTLRSFLSFYIPLAMTSLLTLLAQPIGSAAISRMPLALESLAAWPVVSGLVFMFRSLGMAYNEVVVALLDEPRSSASLRRFTAWLAALTGLAFLMVVITPLARLWFEGVSALPPRLSRLALDSLWLALPMPVLAVLQSWYQGVILHSRQTRSVTEAVAVYLVSNAVLLGMGVAWGKAAGLGVALAAMGLSMALQTAWLGWRSRPMLRQVAAREAETVMVAIR